VDQLSVLIAISPVISCSSACLADEEILGIVYVLIRPGLDAVQDSRLEVDEDGSGDVTRIVTLVVEDIFAVAALRGKIFEVTILVDPMLLAKLLPELASNCRMSARLHRDEPALVTGTSLRKMPGSRLGNVWVY
jgi:hypothetical protein